MNWHTQRAVTVLQELMSLRVPSSLKESSSVPLDRSFLWINSSLIFRFYLVADFKRNCIAGHRRTTTTFSDCTQHSISHPLINYTSSSHIPRGSPRRARLLYLLLFPDRWTASQSTALPGMGRSLLSLSRRRVKRAKLSINKAVRQLPPNRLYMCFLYKQTIRRRAVVTMRRSRLLSQAADCMRLPGRPPHPRPRGTGSHLPQTLI